MGETSSKVVVGDFNGDGKDDVAAVDKAGRAGVKVAAGTKLRNSPAEIRT
ncbi:hypothetical protein [Streptomyces sp. 1222.5]